MTTALLAKGAGFFLRSDSERCVGGLSLEPLFVVRTRAGMATAPGSREIC
jgi:hypothetical protein